MGIPFLEDIDVGVDQYSIRFLMCANPILGGILLCRAPILSFVQCDSFSVLVTIGIILVTPDVATIQKI